MSQKPIRILHVIGRMDRGGAENMIMNLYRNIDREKIQFDFVEHYDKEAAFDAEIKALGGRIYRCPHFNGKNRFEYKKWWNSFLKDHSKEFTAVHGHVGRSAGIYLKIAKKYGMYTIAHSHNTAPKGLGNIFVKMYALPTRFLADYYLACSKDAGKLRYGNKIINNKDKFSVLNNAIDTKQYIYDENIRQKVRKEYGLENKIVIGNIGRFVNQKNHTFLIRVFEEIHNQNSEAKLLLVGDGELRDSIEKSVKEKELTDAVVFAGVQENVSKYYQAMDVFVFPSLFEGLGIVAVEAQCTGLKCVISDMVSKECIVTDDQVSVCNLTDDVKVWAKIIQENCRYARDDSSEQVKQHGYDIRETARWITDFYLGIKKNA